MADDDTTRTDTIARMGYENMIDATAIAHGTTRIEVGLIGPGPFGERWAVAVHVDCDPDIDTAGSSQIETYDSPEAARREFDEQIADIQARGPAAGFGV